MRKFFSALFLFLIVFGAALMLFGLLVGCGGCAAAPPTPRPATAFESEGEFQYAVTLRVGIFCPDDKGELSLTGGGSAVAVTPTKAVTAYHVVEGNCEGAVYRVLDHAERQYVANPTRIAPEADAAVLELRNGERFKRWVEPTAVVPRLDDVVCSIGGDFYVLFMKKCGRVNRNDPGTIYSSIWTKRGNSGGPLFRGRQLIGIIVAARMDPLAEWQSKASAATAWVHLLTESP
jgi:hypothetical protein